MRDFATAGKAVRPDLDANYANAAPPGRATLAGRATQLADRPPAIADEAHQLPPEVRDIVEPVTPMAAPSEGDSTRTVPRIELSSTAAAPTAAAPVATATEANSSPDPSAVEVAGPQQIYSDQHTNPAAAPFEHHHAATKHPHLAKQDKYNNPHVQSNAMHDKHQVGRPGVRVHGNDLFKLQHETAIRYTYVMTNGKRVATPYDQVSNSQLTTTNFNYLHQDPPAGKTRLLLNPAKALHLDIHGKEVLCVLSWLGGLGAAWIPVAALHGDTAAIHAAADHASASWRPADPEGPTTQYVVRNDPVGMSDPAHDKPHGKGNVLTAGATRGDNVTDYLTHEFRREKFDDHGKVVEGKRETKYTLNICLSLPQADAPPVAIDIANAGDHFFAMKAPEFTRQTPVFANGKKYSTHSMTWVFGFVGKIEHGKWVPDHSRRGWVPLRTLALASHLKTTPAK